MLCGQIVEYERKHQKIQSAFQLSPALIFFFPLSLPHYQSLLAVRYLILPMAVGWQWMALCSAHGSEVGCVLVGGWVWGCGSHKWDESNLWRIWEWDSSLQGQNLGLSIAPENPSGMMQNIPITSNGHRVNNTSLGELRVCQREQMGDLVHSHLILGLRFGLNSWSSQLKVNGSCVTSVKFHFVSPVRGMGEGWLLNRRMALISDRERNAENSNIPYFLFPVQD